MKYNVSIKLIDGRIRLILPVISKDNLLMQKIASYSYDELKDLFRPAQGSICVNFYINIVRLKSFESDEEELYYKNPDTEGLYKKRIKDEFLLDKFTCINPQKQFYPLYVPILHISILDYFDDKTKNSKAVILPRYIKYLDSSIWNYYVPYLINDASAANFENRLRAAIKKIISNSLKGLYAINNAREYADLHARQAKQAYMSGVGAHTKNVSPYIFHSETEMEKLIKSGKDCYYETIEKYLRKGFKWRMLIIDDFANEHLKTYPKGGSELTKTDIIVNILQERFRFNKEERGDDSICLYWNKRENPEITIDYVPKIKSDAINRLKEKCYDIILLDYLLKYKDPVEREYSYELLDAITSDEKLHNSAAPFEKFWIYHISSFRSAIQERLQEKGYNYNDKYWHIGQGACPINTPRLFEYRLYHFMDNQINNLRLPVKRKDNTKSNIITLADFFNLMVKAARVENNDSLPEFVARNFEKLLRLRGNYRVLKNELKLFEESNSSVLITSIYKEIYLFENTFWEHLIHLMFLIAYGNSPQWQEMHEELYYLEDIGSRDAVTAIRTYVEQLSKVYK